MPHRGLGRKDRRVATGVRAKTLRYIYADVEAEVVHIEGIPIRVATPRMLYRMKRDTVRPQDRADAELLKQRFDVGDD